MQRTVEYTRCASSSAGRSRRSRPHSIWSPICTSRCRRPGSPRSRRCSGSGRARTGTRETAIARMRGRRGQDDHARRAPTARRHGLCRRHRPAPVFRTRAGAVDARRRRRHRRDMARERRPDDRTAPDSLVDAGIGREIGDGRATATGDVYRRDWQRWAAAVGDHNPLWFDAATTRAPTAIATSICPPLYLQYAILGVAALDEPAARRVVGRGLGRAGVPARAAPDGRRREHDLSPARLSRRRDRDGRAPSSRSSKSRAGQGRFVLVTWRTDYRNQHGELVAEATTSMIARP